MKASIAEPEEDLLEPPEGGEPRGEFAYCARSGRHMFEAFSTGGSVTFFSSNSPSGGVVNRNTIATALLLSLTAKGRKMIGLAMRVFPLG